MRDSLFDQKFDAFTDIEFNPDKSFSCQARTLALCVSLYENESVKDFIQNPVGFSEEFKLYKLESSTSKKNQNLTLF